MIGKNQSDTIGALTGTRYTEFERIAEGGMGAVYKAHDNVLDKDVAIKTLLIDRMTSDMVLRFQQEARAASKLRHPNLITVLDFGIDEKHHPYLVMEYVDGRTLESILAEEYSISFPAALAILIEVCRGIAHAHESGVIHRDLKPSNIMIVNGTNGDTTVKVVDFGIAKLKETKGQALTQTGAMIGSPYYMSPEQIRGDDVDERSDIYSLACIVCRMLNGSVPFKGDTHLDTAKMHLNDEPPLLESEHINEEFQHFMDRCLSKSVDDRPASMNEVLEELRRQQAVLAAEQRAGLEAEQEARARQVAQEQAKRSKKLAADRKKILSVFFILFIGISIYLFSFLQSTPKVDVEVKPKINAFSVVPEIVEGDRAMMGEKWSVSRNQESWKAESNVTDDDLKKIARNRRVLYLSLRGTNITNRALKHLENMKLLELDLSETNVDDNGMKSLAKIESLQSLVLNQTKVTDAGIALLAGLDMRKLSVDDCAGVTDKGIFEIIKHFPSINLLNMGATGATSKSIKRLPSLSRLTSLELGDLELTEEALDAISSMRLSLLSLNHSHIPPDCAAKLKKMKSLTVLLISKTGITSKEYRDLVKALPECKINFDENEELKGIYDFGGFLGE